MSEEYRHDDYAIGRIVVQEGYDEDERTNDDALLELADPVVLSEHIAPIYLRQDHDMYRVSCHNMSWNLDADDDDTPQRKLLKKIGVQLEDHALRRRELKDPSNAKTNGADASKFLCALSLQRGCRCHPDLGALLYADRDGRTELVGIVSSG